MTDPFSEGQAAFHAGVDLEQNPYEASNGEHEDWEEGWAYAMDTFSFGLENPEEYDLQSFP
jgi:hypothetical protein